MAVPVRPSAAVPPGADESQVRIAHPHARACAVHEGEGCSFAVVEHPQRAGAVVLGSGPTEPDAWHDAAERVRAAQARFARA